MKRVISIRTGCFLSCTAMLSLGAFGCGGTPQGGAAPVASAAPAGNAAMPHAGMTPADGAHTPMGNMAGGAATAPPADGGALTPEQQMAARRAAAGTATTPRTDSCSDDR